MRKSFGKAARGFLFAALAACAVFCGQIFTKSSAETGHIQVFVNGAALVSDVQPMNINGSVMIPLRAIGEALGALVD